MRGGDTDTNAAICGALLGAVYGRETIPREMDQDDTQLQAAGGRPARAQAST